jgi:hypothetical protein
MPKQPTLVKDYRNFIPGQPSVITEESWERRNLLADKFYPQVMDLMRFDEDHLMEILLDVEGHKKPARFFPVGPGPRPLAWLPRRSWLEWHLFRGIAPAARRPSIPTATRAAVIARDGLVCQLCGGDVEPGDMHLDHIEPYSKGGPTTVDNLQVTHSVCNMRKGARI